MHVITDLASVPADVRPSAVTIGKFDGLHFGHLELVRRLHESAGARALHPVVVTFDRHPASLVRPDSVPPEIVSTRQKLELLRRQGLTATCVLPFTPEFAALDPVEFVRRVLVEALGMRYLLVGRDFRFGVRGSGDVGLLERLAGEFGYDIEIADDEIGENGRRASSTWVREALAVGDVHTVTEVLGRHHVLTGTVVHGAKRGRELGYPTANLAPDVEGLIPADGVYAGWFSDGDTVYPTALSIGNNPTFEGVPQKQVEAHLLDADVDLYGRRVQIALVERIRAMEKFDGVEALLERIRLDVVETRRILGIAAPDGD